MTPTRQNIWLAITALFAVCLVVLQLSHLVTDPSKVIPELGGDGIKNTFTYLYQCMYGHGYWFNGMNYPYGEHIVYTDAQPLLVGILTAGGNITAGSVLTVLWLLIGSSYVLAILYVYKTLVHFKVAPFIAMLFAGLIIVFSPQVLRLQSHYALTYPCVVPMIFYWTIRYNETLRTRYCLYMFLLGCILVFIHPYFAALLLIWALLYAVSYLVWNKTMKTAALTHTARLIVYSFLVFVIVFVVMKVTDPIKDRPQTPFSTFYENCTRPKQLVTSVHSSVWNYFAAKKSTKYYISDGGEGYTYLGLVVIITLGICFVLGAIRTFRKKKLDILVEPSGFSPIWLFIAVAALLFAMGVPFVWHLQWLLGYISFFKQFRSLGRFSWIFYYIITVYAVIAIYTFYARKVAERKLVAAYAALLLAIGCWSYEASGYIRFTRQLSLSALYNYRLVFSTEEQTWPVFLEEHHHSSEDFQAVLMLPFFHIGTEKLWVGDPDWMVMLGSKASLQLHLPMVDVMMSRSSWSEAQKQVKIAAGPYVQKPVLEELKSNKPFLLMHFEDDSLNPDQKYLLEASDYIGHKSQCNVYACYPDRIKANDRKNADSVNKIVAAMHGSDTIINNTGTYYYAHYDSVTNADHIFGTGGLPPIPGDSTYLLTLPVAVNVPDSQVYECSCWFLLGNKDYKSPFITLEMLDATGKQVAKRDVLTTKSTESNGMWFRASVFFYVHSDWKSIRFNLMNIPKPTYFAMDELLLRPAGSLVIAKDGQGRVMVNNHLFKK